MRCHCGWSAGGAGCLSARHHQTMRNNVRAKTRSPRVMCATSSGTGITGEFAITSPAMNARITAVALDQWMAMATLPYCIDVLFEVISDSLHLRRPHEMHST